MLRLPLGLRLRLANLLLLRCAIVVLRLVDRRTLASIGSAMGSVRLIVVATEASILTGLGCIRNCLLVLSELQILAVIID